MTPSVSTSCNKDPLPQEFAELRKQVEQLPRPQREKLVALTDRIKEMILDRKPASELRKEAIAGGMTSLREAGIEKVLHGETTLKEVNRVTFSHGGAV